MTTSFLFIDASVEDHHILTTNIQPGTHVHLLDAHQDGVEQITQVLQSADLNSSKDLSSRGLSHHESYSIHIVTHGSPGSLSLGNTELGLATLNRYKQTLQAWGQAQSTLHLYSCNVAAGDAGEEFITKLHHITGATIYASTTKVGNAKLGGTWRFNAIAHQSRFSILYSPLSSQNVGTIFSEKAIATYPGVLSNLIRNGSFEDGTHRIGGVDGLTNWSNWASSAPDALDDNTSGAEFSGRGIDASDGTGYVLIANNKRSLGQFSEAVVQTLRTPLQEGERYTFTIDALTVGFDANDTEDAAEINLYSIDGGNATVVATIPIAASLGWQEDQSLTFTAPTDISQIGISSSEAPVYIDNARLTAGGNLNGEPDIGEGEVNGRVWFDTNENGLFDDGEAGVANVGVILLQVDGEEVSQKEAFTDADGNYSFTDLPDTSYQVRLGTDLGEEVGLTISNVGEDDTIDSDLITGNRTVVFEMNAGKRVQSYDIGLTGTLNLAPTTTDDTATTRPDTAVTIDVLANDTSSTLQSINERSGEFTPVQEAIGNIGSGITHTATSDTNKVFLSSSTPGMFAVGEAQGIFGGSLERQTHTFSEEVEAVRLTISSFGAFTSSVRSEAAEFRVDGRLLNLNTALADGTVTLTGEAGATINRQGQLFNDTDTLSNRNTTVLTINRPLTSFSIENVSEGGKGAGIWYELEAIISEPPQEMTPPTVIIDGVGDPVNGSAEVVDGKIVYTPDDGFIGTETFAYRAKTEGGPGSIAQVTVTVENDAPEAVDDTASTNINTAVTIDALANDTDGNNQPLSINGVGNPVNGTAEIVDGKIVYTPDTDFAGTETFAYQVTDGTGGSDIGEITVTVEAPNFAPEANEDTVSTLVNTAITIDALANDTDANNQTLTLDGVGTPVNGIAEVADGQVVYTPNTNFIGSDTFAYQVNDGAGGTDIATITVNIFNNTPEATNDTATTAINTAITLDVLANDTDADGQTLAIAAVGTPASGTAEVTNNQILFTPATDFVGSSTFAYLLSDGNGGTDIGEVTVTIGTEASGTETSGTGTSGSSGSTGNTTATILGTDGNDAKLNGTAQDDVISGLAGKDNIRAKAGNDEVFGDGGNDKLVGGKGDDILNGTNSTLRGAGEKDSLAGNKGADTFVLGDADGAFYTTRGKNDRAYIGDFNAELGDKVQLFGSADAYSTKVVKGKTELFLGEGSSKDLIAVVNTTALDLNSSAFDYVG